MACSVPTYGVACSVSTGRLVIEEIDFDEESETVVVHVRLSAPDQAPMVGAAECVPLAMTRGKVGATGGRSTGNHAVASFRPMSQG